MTGTQVFRNTLIVLLTLAVAYIMVAGLHIWVVLLIAVAIASALRPLVVRLTRWRVPAALSIVISYLLLLVVIILLVAVVFPPFVNQFANYLQNENGLAVRIIRTQNWIETEAARITGTDVELLDNDQIRDATSDLVDGFRDALPTVAGDLSNVLGDAVLVFVMGIYWLTSREKGTDFLASLFTRRNRELAQEIVEEIEVGMGTYIRGVVLVATFVGIANFLILSLLRVPNAATLGFIVGVTTMIPVVGGLIGGVTAVVIAALNSPLHGLFVLGSFIAVQQVEANYLTPRTMARSFSLDPILVMIAVFIGFALYGVTGGIIAVPLVGTIGVLLRRLVIEPRQRQVEGYKVEHGGVILDAKPAQPTEAPPDVSIETT